MRGTFARFIPFAKVAKITAFTRDPNSDLNWTHQFSPRTLFPLHWQGALGVTGK